MARTRWRGGHGAVVGRETLSAGPYEVAVTRKNIVRMYLHVRSAEGPVEVSAPAGLPQSAVSAFVLDHAAWIDERRAALAQGAPASPRRGHICPDGTVLLWGERIPLEEVSPKAASLLAKAGLTARDAARLAELSHLAGKGGTATESAAQTDETKAAARAERAVAEALREELARRAEPLVRRYEDAMGVRVDDLRYRDMQTRWGTCNMREHRVWLATSLAHFDPSHTELIVVHELCHLLERGHGKRFKALMDRYLPDWRSRDRALSEAARNR